jgi:hypothetical protein
LDLKLLLIHNIFKRVADSIAMHNQKDRIEQRHKKSHAELLLIRNLLRVAIQFKIINYQEKINSLTNELETLNETVRIHSCINL